MNISSVAMTAIIPEKGYYQALYNNPKNDLDITNKLLNKLEKMGVYEERLYGKDNGVFAKHLTNKGFKQCLTEYNEIKRVKEKKGIEIDVVMPKTVKETGIRALKTYLSNERKNKISNKND